jgi:hypothetical protein
MISCKNSTKKKQKLKATAELIAYTQPGEIEQQKELTG